jgi:hypothetical protein
MNKKSLALPVRRYRPVKIYVGSELIEVDFNKARGKENAMLIFTASENVKIKGWHIYSKEENISDSQSEDSTELSTRPDDTSLKDMARAKWKELSQYMDNGSEGFPESSSFMYGYYLALKDNLTKGN